MSNTEAKGKITAVSIAIPVICMSVAMIGIERLLLFITEAECNKIILECFIIVSSIAVVCVQGKCIVGN